MITNHGTESVVWDHSMPKTPKSNLLQQCRDDPKVGMLGNEVHALETQDQWLCNTCKHNGVEEGKTLFVTQPWFLPARDQVGQGGEAVINALCTNGHQLLSRFKSMSWGQGPNLQGGCNLCVQISLKSMCTCSPDRVEGKHHGTFNMACVQPEKAHQKKCGLLSNCRQHRRSPEELRTTSKGAFQLVSEIRASRPQQMNSEPS